VSETREPGYYWVWVKVGGGGVGPPGRLTIAEYDPGSEEHPRLFPWSIIGDEDILGESELVIAGPIERPRFCVMLVGHSSLNPTPDIECGKVGAYGFRGDPNHICCADCYELMRSHDADLLRGYVPLAELAREAPAMGAAP
jgi:hypothetical protein